MEHTNIDQLRQTVATQRQQIQWRQAQHMATLSELKSARARASDLAWELEELEQRLRDLYVQREGPDDPLVEREIGSIRSKRAAVEDQALGKMIEVDELGARYEEENRALAASLDELAMYKSQLQSALDEHTEVSEATTH